MAAELQNIRFVQEIKKYAFLYNYKDPDYMRKDMTDAAWSEIGRKFKISGPAAKEKWKNLRSVFVRHLKPYKSGLVRRKPYYLSEYLQFAVPYIKKPLDQIPGAESFRNRTITIDDDSDEPPTPEPKPPAAPQPSSTKKQTTDEPQPRSNANSASCSKPTENNSSNEDCNKMFLLSLLSDMNQMNLSQIRLFKRKVLGLIDSIMEESPPAPVSPPSPVSHSPPRQVCKEESEEFFDEESMDSDPLLL